VGVADCAFAESEPVMTRSNMEGAPHIASSAPATQVSGKEKDQIAQAATPSQTPIGKPPPKNLSLKQLINTINHINFQDLNITVVFQHNKYQRILNLPAYPLPCKDERLVCQWVDPVDIELLLESYQFHCLNIPKGQQLIEVHPELRSISEQQIVFILPEICREISERKIHRHQCHDISVFMFQNGALFNGKLVDYGAFQFRIVVETISPQNYHWIDTQTPVTIVFTKGRDTLYSGECKIVKHDHGFHNRHFILAPTHRQTRRFISRQFRSTRQRLSPSLDAVFTHPLFGKNINLKIIDISGSGFSVEEENYLAVLLPGLKIPDLALSFSDGSCARCMAQVVYSKPHREGPTGSTLRCGIAILDMAIEDHIKLLALLHQANDAHAYLCHKVDMDSLWDFFFETGFIYPQKYEFIRNNKDKIKSTYEKLYHLSPSIASHFLYQENGRIRAHMAMIRFYENAWMIHHHAAVRSSNNRGGLMVLNQVSRFINDSYRLSSMKMDYVFCYYRPDNKFPNHVFGGTARNIRNPQICSVDNFAYFHYNPNTSEKQAELSGNWQLVPAVAEDLLDLQTIYENQSGGLMLRGLHLHPDQMNCTELVAAYANIGLKRNRHIFALNHREKLCAIVVINVADIGLNMSDLTNSIQFFVTHGIHLTYEVIQNTIAHLSGYLELMDTPVLLYPRDAARQAGVEFEKTYCLWVYDTHQNLDHYFRFLKRLLKFIQP
jgi:hypothetical protein